MFGPNFHLGSARVLLACAFTMAACGGGSTQPHPDGSVPDGGSFDASETNGDGGPVCDPSLRQCAHVFSFTFTGGTTQPTVVEVRGTFNSWQAGVTPMTLANGVWTATVNLPWDGTVEYKFWAQWSDNPNNPVYYTDAANPLIAADGNSELMMVECSPYACLPPTPQLDLVAPPTTTATSYTFQAQFVPGTADLDTTKTVITVNGATPPTSAWSYDASTKMFSVSVTSGITSPNKYSWLFKVTDKAGVSTSLFVPFWIESSPFEWQDAFLYEVMVDRFLPGKTVGMGTSLAGPTGGPTEPTKSDWQGGDYGGLLYEINEGYFDKLGVNALWVSQPDLNTSLCEEGTGANTGKCIAGYHSYFPMTTGWVDGSENDPIFKSQNITTPIDPHFGTIADLQAVVSAAHTHGIRVLSDFVVNHVFGDSAPPAGQTPQLSPLWLAHQTDTAWFNLPYNAAVNDCGNENLWDTDISQTWNRENCWFDPYLPDFNTASPIVDQTIAAHAVWLMETFNFDGFRVDATKQVNNAVAAEMRSELNAIDSTALPIYMVGEALGSNVGNVMDCVGIDKLNGSLDDDMHYSMVSTFLYGSESPNDFDNDVMNDETTWSNIYPEVLMGHFFGSHDVSRAISEAAGDDNGDPWDNPPPAQEIGKPQAFARLGMAQAFLLTYDPIPILWMGDEFGQPGTIDPDNRRMMRFNSDLGAAEQSALALAQTIGTTRLAHPALRRGARTRLYVDGNVYSYGRTYSDGGGNDIVIAAFNFNTTTSETVQLIVDPINLTQGTVTDVISGTSAVVTVNNSQHVLTVTLPPLTAAIYVQAQ